MQKKLEGMGAAHDRANIEVLVQYYKLPSALDLWYGISVKSIDLKDLKLFHVTGDRLEAPKPLKPVFDSRHTESEGAAKPGKDAELLFSEKAATR